ncbi:MAG: ABC transporter ATP-binding protein, partial [Pseudomonadota bacterium]
DLAQTNSDAILTGKVDFTEALGEVTLLYFETSKGAENVIAKLPGIQRNLRGQSVSVTAIPEKVHLFCDGVSMRRQSSDQVAA